MEQILDWLNENELRAYPLLEPGPRLLQVGEASLNLPDNFLVDLQLKVLNYSLANHIPILRKIETSTEETLVTFSVLSTVTENISTLTVFSIPTPATQPYPFYARNADGCLAVFGEGVKLFLEENPGNASYLAEIPVEPSTVTQFNEAWLGVSSILTSPEKISDPTGRAPLRPLVDVYDYLSPITEENGPTKLIGDVKFLEGYHFRVDIAAEAVDLEIGANFGLRTNCTTSFISEEYLDCHELISYINGVPPDNAGNFRLTAGANITITAGSVINTNFNDSLTETSNDNTLFVGLTFQATDLCAPVNINPSLL